jgi:CDP-6-deoxy-D-xylo-4-hexulose-3-dehydrase
VAEPEARGVGARMPLGGDLTRQPAFMDVPYRIAGPLDNGDKIMTDRFWIGIRPGIGPEALCAAVNRQVG